MRIEFKLVDRRKVTFLFSKRLNTYIFLLTFPDCTKRLNNKSIIFFMHACPRHEKKFIGEISILVPRL